MIHNCFAHIFLPLRRLLVTHDSFELHPSGGDAHLFRQVTGEQINGPSNKYCQFAYKTQRTVLPFSKLYPLSLGSAHKALLSRLIPSLPTNKRMGRAMKYLPISLSSWLLVLMFITAMLIS